MLTATCELRLKIGFRRISSSDPLHRHGGGRAPNSDEFVRLHYIPLKKYIPSDSQETILQMYTRIFSLEVKMVEIL